ncbi:LysR family transcriptional regulator [Bradyrhizobium japonicum]|uniref:LysR family transcriptional regulator n=1 Tax=Bradyrhizobium japonicum TaxID=375 RepID=UPI001BAB4FFA|nr:LysR family transcriptional regulator [Bradyrhizobium japonicum]MBR0733188.1 LysR family transcriptional regulator [Bradyrhizobium japonicum]
MESPVAKHAEELDLHALRVLDVLFRERSITRAASALNTQQPALSKTLARLRRYFDDPLFVRVSLHMEPTAKALELEKPVRAVLDGLQRLRSEQTRFEAPASRRVFRVFTLDAGVIVILLPIIKSLLTSAPGVRLRAAQVGLQNLHPSLESGDIDLAIGEFPLLIPGIRRQKLFSGQHMCLFQKDHPRLRRTPSLGEFMEEQHIFITAAGTGHPHQVAERSLEQQLPAKNIIAHVPTFTAAAILAKSTNAVATMPGPVAAVLARELDMQLARPPLKLPAFEIAQYWHERFDRDPGNQWLRTVIYSQFGGKPPARKR